MEEAVERTTVRSKQKNCMDPPVSPVFLCYLQGMKACGRQHQHDKPSHGENRIMVEQMLYNGVSTEELYKISITPVAHTDSQIFNVRIQIFHIPIIVPSSLQSFLQVPHPPAPA